jgi:hypothetical protein
MPLRPIDLVEMEEALRLIHAGKLTPIRRAKMNGDPPTGRIGLMRLNAHQKTGRLTCILPPDSPARALRTCAP